MQCVFRRWKILRAAMFQTLLPDWNTSCAVMVRAYSAGVPQQYRGDHAAACGTRAARQVADR